MKIHRKYSKKSKALLLLLFISIFFYFDFKNLFYISYDTETIDVSSLRKLQINFDIYNFRLKRYQLYQKTQYERNGPGELGNPVRLKWQEVENLDDMTKEDDIIRLLSDRISVQRSISDGRSSRCKEKKYPIDLPIVSVVIIFYNEPLSTLLRTVYSVINRTPPRYLKEIVLLDDFSYSAGLDKQLDDYIASEWQDGIVRLVRNQERLGLINARLEGAKVTTGEVLMFLDSHCEVTEGWLEPLLFRIYQQRSAVIIPNIQSIEADTLQYSTTSTLSQVGTFAWSMKFTWERIYQHLPSDSDYAISPVMAGGLFAIDRKYFYEIGAYDEGMKIWGGENLEISFRIWTCGGSLETSSCSRVGHIFRKGPVYSSTASKDYFARNTKRMVEVWLDDYKRLFYLYRPEFKNIDVGDIQSRIDLRKRLKCKPFRWYIENIVPYKFIPDVNVTAFGFVRNHVSGLCIELLDSFEFDGTNIYAKVYYCPNGLLFNQIFSMTLVKNYSLPEGHRKGDPASQIRREWGCLTVYQKYGSVHFMNCFISHMDSQLWAHDQETGAIVNLKFNQCLDATGLRNSDIILINSCDSSNEYQKWKFQYYL